MRMRVVSTFAAASPTSASAPPSKLLTNPGMSDQASRWGKDVNVPHSAPETNRAVVDGLFALVGESAAATAVLPYAVATTAVATAGSKPGMTMTTTTGLWVGGGGDASASVGAGCSRGMVVDRLSAMVDVAQSVAVAARSLLVTLMACNGAGPAV